MNQKSEHDLINEIKGLINKNKLNAELTENRMQTESVGKGCTTCTLCPCMMCP